MTDTQCPICTALIPELEALRNGTQQLVTQLGDLTKQRDRAIELEREWCKMAVRWQKQAEKYAKELEALKQSMTLQETL